MFRARIPAPGAVPLRIARENIPEMRCFYTTVPRWHPGPAGRKNPGSYRAQIRPEMTNPFEVIITFKCPAMSLSVTAMKPNLCTHTTRRIQRLGYPHKAAAFYAGFLCTSMVLVCAVMGALRVPSQAVNEGTYGYGHNRAAARHLSFLSAEAALRR